MPLPNGQTVLITGANGFLGRNLIHRLGEHDGGLYAISRRVPSDERGVRWIQGDLTNSEWLSGVVAEVKPDIVFHLASESAGGQGSELVLPTFENDLRATVNTLLAVQATGCQRVVLAASLEEPALDGGPLTVASPYAAAKACSTYYGLMFHQLYGVPVALLRLFMTYGPGQKAHKVIPYTIQTLLEGRAPQLSSGARPVDWVFVEDAMSALIAAAARPEAVGQIIDIGSGELLPVREVVEQIHRLIPGSPPPAFGALPDRAAEIVRRADVKGAKSLLGWSATTPMVEGLTRTIDWYREQQDQTGARQHPSAR